MDIVFKINHARSGSFFEVHEIWINDFDYGVIYYNKKQKYIIFYLVKGMNYRTYLLLKIADYMNSVCDCRYDEPTQFSFLPDANECMVERIFCSVGVILFNLDVFVQFERHGLFAKEIYRIINFMQNREQKSISWKRVGF